MTNVLNGTLREETATELLNVDYVAEFALLNDFVSELVLSLANIIGTNGSLTINDVMTFVKEAMSSEQTFNVAYAAIDALEILANSKVIELTGIDFYNAAIELLVTTPSNESRRAAAKDSTHPLAVAEGYTNAQFMSDYTSLLDVLTSVVDLAVANATNINALTADVKALLTDKNVYEVLPIVSAILDLNIADYITLNAYELFVYNTMSEGFVKDILDLREVYGTNEALIAELQAILTAAQGTGDSSFTAGLASVANDVLNQTNKTLFYK